MVEKRKDTQEPRRRRRTIWIAVLIAVLIPVGLTVYIVHFIRGEATISHDYAAEYNALLRPADYDPNENAEPLYERACNLMFPEACYPIPPYILHKKGALSIEQYFKLAGIGFDSEAFDLIAQASAKPYCWTEMAEPSQLYGAGNFVKIRGCVYALGYQAELAAEAGDMQKAFHHLMMAERVAMHVQLPCGNVVQRMIASMIPDDLHRTAFDVLADYPADSSLLRDYQAHLEEFLARRPSHSLAPLRLVLLDTVQRWFTDNGHGDGHIVFKRFRLSVDHRRPKGKRSKMTDVGLYLKDIWTAWRHPSRGDTVHCIDDLLHLSDRLAQQTPWQLHQQGGDHRTIIQSSVPASLKFRLWGAQFSLGELIEQNHRSQALGSALVATIAALRYEKDEGAWPDSLQQLVEQGYLRQVPMDPYSDGPLVYRPVASGFTLYSLGRDFDDDGGTPDPHNAEGRDGDDVFWKPGVTPTHFTNSSRPGPR